MHMSDVLTELEKAIAQMRWGSLGPFAVVWLEQSIKCIPKRYVEPGTEVFGYVTRQDCIEGLRSDDWDRIIAHILMYLKRTGKCQDP